MEALVFLVIISLVVRSLYRNSKEAKRKEAERQERSGEPLPQPKQKSRTRPSLPGSLPEWIEMLGEEPSMEGKKQPAPFSTPAAPVKPGPPLAVPQGVATEGCQTFPRDCESPHHLLQAEQRREARREVGQRQSSPFSFLKGMPEVMQGVVYAEILTRPQHRRRLRP